MGEFDLIARYFTRPAGNAVLGVGDDCALIETAPGMQLAISSDMLVEGRHFFAGCNAAALGHKALAVNLSDLAACGARAMAFTLALSLPRPDEAWLEGFSSGMWALAEAHGCNLIGGDTTQGPLTICITVLGQVPRGQALLRSGAQAGDDIYVSGSLGDARLALDVLRGQLALPAELMVKALARLERPTPRLALGQALRGIASAAVDVSDGLAGDLSHVLARSSLGACIEVSSATYSIADCAGSAWAGGLISLGKLLDCIFAGGDDYELAFTAPVSARQDVMAASQASNTPVTRIGRTESQPGLRIVDASGQALAHTFASFDHFG